MNKNTKPTAHTEMPIFTRSYDLLTWLLPRTNDFPRAHRHTFTKRLLDAAFDLRERLEEANLRQGSARMERLIRADEKLGKTINMLSGGARFPVYFGWLITMVQQSHGEGIHNTSIL